MGSATRCLVIAIASCACGAGTIASDLPDLAASSGTGFDVVTADSGDSGWSTSAGPSSGLAGSEDDSGSSDGGDDPLPPASVEGVDLLCKLINDESVDDPTDNRTHTRFNLRATDLGVPLVIGSDLHLFFGDTHGHREIWAIGEDPDSVAFVPAAAAAEDPTVLCTELSFYTTADVPSVAADTDPAIERDFAVGWMSPPAGESIADYVTQHPPPFPNVPGSFEVPSGALAVGDDVYLFWAGKAEFEPHARMTLGYLVRWDPPRTFPEYQIVRPIDALHDGALGGHFIQVLPFVAEDTLYMFGTGEFRRSGIHLARMPVADLERGGSTEIYDPRTESWVDPATLDAPARAAIPPVVETDGVGELGGVYLPGPDLYLLMYQHASAAGGTLLSNRIVVRTAPAPTGPWSEPLTVIDMADPAFAARHCCLAEPCTGEQIWKCEAAGLYAAYPLPNPRLAPRDDGTFSVDLPFVVSTWIPYNVALFEAHLVLPSSSTSGPRSR